MLISQDKKRRNLDCVTVRLSELIGNDRTLLKPNWCNELVLNLIETLVLLNLVTCMDDLKHEILA